METDGYDLLVYVDEDGDIVVQGLTEMGRDFLRMMFPGIDGTEIVELLIGPKEFEERVGSVLHVGFRSPDTGKIHPMREVSLH